MGLPAESHLEFLARAVREQKVEDCTAFFFRHAVDVRGKVAIDVQRLAFGYRMRADDRMRGPGKDLSSAAAALQDVDPAIDRVAGMSRRQSLKISFHARRKRIIGRVLADKERIASRARHGVEV